MVPTTLDKPYVIVLWVLTCGVVWCHLIYVGEKYLIDSACGCWGGGSWGLNKFSQMHCTKFQILYHTFQLQQQEQILRFLDPHVLL